MEEENCENHTPKKGKNLENLDPKRGEQTKSFLNIKKHLKKIFRNF
jgi:hypothetical protein